MSALLAVRDLHAAYGTTPVLRGIDFDLRAGETVALMGRNGMGKTTLLRALMGLVPRRRGRVTFAGRDTENLAPETLSRAGIALVPQGRGIFASLTVLENLRVAARAGLGGRHAWTLERTLTLFPQLQERRRHYGDELSGGEQQMLAIARALVTNPTLVLVDEATEGLAPRVAAAIWRTLAAMAVEGLATLVVDKDLAAISRIASRVLVLDKGRLVFEGRPDALAADPALREKHLGLVTR